MKRVIFISSIGGHLEELLKLQDIFAKYNSLLVTEKNETTKSLDLPIPIKYLKFGTRKHLFSYLFIFSWNILKSFWIFAIFHPDVVITTGAHTSVPMIFLAHFFKKKILFIESIARVNSTSMAGRLIEKKVDKIFVQWEEMLEVYQNAEYHGRLL
ncbi:MAG: polysaccharide biosynthesis protein [Streptococcaceae bacterium]|jgi:UDP-N-acetylglucosamine:LPS N-acetylglucosamine transferase|nr:polysaccharide biosynthesis protein [Streptococcaceae bacterium]